MKFSLNTESPHAVGSALGRVVGDKEQRDKVKNALESGNEKIKYFMSGYVWERFRIVGAKWLDEIHISVWGKEAIAQLFMYFSFNYSTWQKVEVYLDGCEDLYWKKVSVRPYFDREKLDYAVDKLLINKRPLAAVECLNAMLMDKFPLNIALSVDVLLSAVVSDEDTDSMTSYHISEVIKYIQKSNDVSEDDLFKIEWAYLPLLEGVGEAKPMFLFYKLASDPGFYCEIISLMFRSKNDNTERKSTETERKLASNAYQLLHNWKIPPGTKKDGCFSDDVFDRWLSDVIRISTKSGHLDVALSQLGQVLFYAPEDQSGLWVNISIAKALNARELDSLRRGYRTGVLNSRGVHWVDPEGKPEKELSIKYMKRAEEVEEQGLQRFAVILREISDYYEAEVQRIISDNDR